jgi:hypothetical protein
MRMWKSRRTLAGLGALATITGLTLFVVLPAIASTAGDFVAPASGQNVLPVDMPIGGTGDCSNLFHSFGAVNEYDNVNPKSTTNFVASGNKDGASFKLTLHTDSNKNQTLDVNSTGAVILGIGIKGGTHTTAYNYVTGPYVTGSPGTYTTTTGPTSVTGDTALHSPLQSFTNVQTLNGSNVEAGAQFYTISQLTVCYLPFGSVSGKVYRDNSQPTNGAFDSGTDSLLSGWTVNLYDGQTFVASATSAADGTYTVAAQLTTGHTYTVCETPPAGTWVQSQPAADNACSGLGGNLPKGYQFTASSPSQKVTGKDFGNVGAVECTEPMGPANFKVELPGAAGCKQNTFAFNSGIDPNRNGKPFVSLLVGDPTQAQVPAAERLTFDDPIVNGQPLYKGLEYTDQFPVDYSNVQPMPYCLINPLDPSNAGDYQVGADSSLFLGHAYIDAAGSSQVLPPGATSCVISITTTAPTTAGGNGKLVADVYSLVDSHSWPT